MADNLLDAACQSEPPQTAKRIRLDSDQEEDNSIVGQIYSQETHGLGNHDKMLEGLDRLRLSGTLCDVTLCCEGQEVLCHRAVLASCSSYFEAIFTSGTEESTQDRVTITGVDPQMMALLVDCTYTSTMSVSKDNVQALLAASDLLEFTAVSDYMKRYMDVKDVSGEPPSSPKTSVRFVLPSHPEKVLEGLDRQRLSGTLCDVTLCCEGQEVLCHRAVLASFSSYFEAMFTSGMKESSQDRVSIRGVEPHIMDVLLSSAYTCQLAITTTITQTGEKHSNVKALLSASDLFDVKAVREWCSGYLERHVDIKNCVETYCFAEAHSCEGLKKRSMDYILEDFSVLYQREEFLSLPVDRVTEILSSDHLNVPEEDMVFDAAMLWLDKNPTHKNNFEKVIEVVQHVRLPLIPPSLLPHVMESLWTLDALADQQGCKGFLSRCDTTRPRRRTVIVTAGAKHPMEGVNALESFDPLTKEWKSVTALHPLPSKVNNPRLIASGSTLYLAGQLGHSHYPCDWGSDSPIATSPWAMWRCDPHSSWSMMAPFKEERSHYSLSLVVLDGCLFAVGGWGSEKSEGSMERYDHDTDTWQLMESVGVNERHCSRGPVVALDGHLYFIGLAAFGEVAKFNPNTSVWTQLVVMEEFLDDFAACVLNGKIYVTGGKWYGMDDEGSHGTYIQPEDWVMCYHPLTNRWKQCAPLRVKRSRHSMTVVDGKMYVLGGGHNGDGNRLDMECYSEEEDTWEIECYSEEEDTWEIVGKLPGARFGLFGCVSLKLRNDHGQPIENEDDDDKRCHKVS